ncbi:MAG: branched-chain amino acid ABC transporter permease [Desulfobacteraceae bacterium]|nr:branched-chain amino acid ABC transporter permease [Desulfobacteraceae bacterium]MCF8093944.1 branched-chain amino acid ABC transporter permease [Desulfobacteraceae bacterium]
MQEILQYLFSGITNGAIYAVIAVGFSMLYSSTELINFAHGEFVMLGALSMVTLAAGFGWPLVPAFVLTVAAVGMAGLLFERLAIRPVRQPDHIVLIIITVGASIFLRGLGMLIWGKDAYSMQPFSDHPPIDVAGAKLLAQSIWILVIVMALTAGLHLFYRRTLTGKAMSACAVSKKAAWIVGIPTKWMVLLAFALATAMGAVAGAIIAPVTMSSYDMGTVLGLKGFCAAMLGGLGSLWGAILGGFLLGILEALGVGFVSSGLKDATAFVLLLLVLYVRPQGIIGSAEVKRF